jgi:uncharacterized protein DUF6084
MPELVFDCTGAGPERFAAVPTLTFKVRIAETSGDPVHAIALRCQIRIEPQRRRYTPKEADGLLELFGGPERWGETLKPMQFATVSTIVGGFAGSTEIDVQVPCSYDLEVAAGKYFDALADGEVPLLLLFSGTVFSKGEQGFSVQQLPWQSETSWRLPARAWRQLMDLYFPNEGWVRLHREVLDGLRHYKATNAYPTFDAAVSALLAKVHR